MIKNDLTSQYAGLKLKNPIVVASSGQTDSVAKIKKLAEAGVAAVVIKSLFEEQLEGLTQQLSQEQDHVEAYDYINQYVQSNEIEKHLEIIRTAKKENDIPIIASVNCFKSGKWVEYAKHLVDAGADALEVNIMRLETGLNADPSSVIKDYLAIAKEISNEVNVPVAVKLDRHFSTLVSLIDRLSYTGIKGVTLFNRSYRMDVDIQHERIVSGKILTSSEDLADTLRYTGLISAKVPKVCLSASTGIHTAEDALKALLVGASNVQLCSTLYQNGPSQIQAILQGIDSWMSDKQYRSISEFRGKLKAHEEDATLYSRMQFMKYFSNKE